MGTDDYSTSGIKIVVAGVGGGGCNTIKRLVKFNVKGPRMLAINTDRIHLNTMPENVKKILLGPKITRGLGAGGFPETARRAAESSRAELEKELEGADLLFLVSGMGGGTGTGASPLIAEIAKKNGAIVVGMVTFPFKIERARLQKAAAGIQELRKYCDTLIIIDNNKLVEYYPNLPIEQTFMLADEISARAIGGITKTLLEPSLVNLDFADLRSVMATGGISMIAVGEGKGMNKVDAAVKNTLEHKLLDVNTEGAKGVLLHITGGNDMTLGEVTSVGEKITEMVDPEAGVIWGSRLDPSYDQKIEVIAIFTGLKEGPALLESTMEKDLGMKTTDSGSSGFFSN